MRLRVISLPKVTPKKFYQRLIEHMKNGTPLPASWDVELGWRNPKTRYGATKRWRYDNFEDAVSDSREGFNSLLHDILVRRLRRLM
jgi:hypothetical protein